ncbi:MAG: glycosyl hydrolase, partial [Bacteroidales bacterium]|nr:glycosyl hydrolase [Bacteroidales bacterium]
RPVVSTEIYGAFREKDQHFDSLMLYRPMFESFARGVNFVVPHGMWYNPELVYIAPLVSSYNEEIAPALPAYSKFVGRSCMLLQGGRRISEIGVMYPIEELAGHFIFDNPEGIRQGFYVSDETDYQDISGILSNDIRRDFTFVHPEFFLEDKYQIENAKVKLNNAENFQEYKVMILTGCKTISYKTLEKLKAFYESGGTIISTTQLPYKSSEMSGDQKVVELVQDIFGIDALTQNKSKILKNTNGKGGVAIFIPQPNKSNIAQALETISPDVQFVNNPELATDFGKFNYIHKIKDGQDIFLFTNSSDEEINTEVLVRGNLKLHEWNPHTGLINKTVALEKVIEEGQEFTKFSLSLNPVKSVFWISSN